MNKKRKCKFSDRLLNYIAGRSLEDDEKAMSMLNRRLAQAHDDTETLLHFAIRWNNFLVAEKLLELGADVDAKGEHGETPLMEAVQTLVVECIEVLLEANANIDIVDDDGQSALQMALDVEHYDSSIVEEFMTRRLKIETTTTEELANRLTKGGCNMHHTIALKDINLMECMLNLGIDVDSKNCEGRTALHAAAQLEELNLAQWLKDHGADVNAVDKDAFSPLRFAAATGNKDMMKLLLEHGADPNCKDSIDDWTPLFKVIEHGRNNKRFFECAKLLLDNGAIPQNSTKSSCTIFDYALFWTDEEVVKMLISHLAMLERLNTSDTEFLVFCNYERFQPKTPELKSFHKSCVQMLKISFVDKLTLFDLLQLSEYKRRLLVRNENFILKVEKACSDHKLKELHSYYYDVVMEHITKAKRKVKLEDEAVPVITKIFDLHRDLCYNCVREITSYLKESDLQQLIKV